MTQMTWPQLIAVLFALALSILGAVWIAVTLNSNAIQKSHDRQIVSLNETARKTNEILLELIKQTTKLELKDCFHYQRN